MIITNGMPYILDVRYIYWRFVTNLTDM